MINQPNKLITQYNNYINSKKYISAIRICKLGKKKFPLYRDIHGDLFFHKEHVRTLLKLNRVKDAFYEITDNSNEDLNMILARHFVTCKDYELADLLLSKILIKKPGDKEALRNAKRISDATFGKKHVYKSISIKHVKEAISLLPTRKQRIKFYLGKHIAKNCSGILIEEQLDKAKDYMTRWDWMKLIHSRKDLKKISEKSYIGKAYTFKLLKILKNLNLNPKVFALIIGDFVPTMPLVQFPYIAKVRQSNSMEFGTILKCLNQERHWSEFEKISAESGQSFESRLEKAVWRGATTHSGLRLKLVEKFFKSTDFFDVGFSKIVQNKDHLQKYVKGSMTIEEMAKYKYIISLPGNDKDSGLSWKLASGSVVIMPRPTSHSWLGEKFLIPGFHYLQINNDFSDLKLVLDWCRNNQNRCKRIAFNSKIYMTQFLDSNSERSLQENILRNFFNSI